MKKVIRLTESELTDLIERIITETQHMDMEEGMHGEMEEGMFGPGKEELEELKADLIRRMDDLLEENGLEEEDLINSIESVLEKAKDSNYRGDVRITTTSKGMPMFKFEAEPSRFHKSKFYKNIMEPMVGGMKSGHSFGGGYKK